MEGQPASTGSRLSRRAPRPRFPLPALSSGVFLFISTIPMKSHGFYIVNLLYSELAVKSAARLVDPKLSRMAGGSVQKRVKSNGSIS